MTRYSRLIRSGDKNFNDYEPNNNENSLLNRFSSYVAHDNDGNAIAMAGVYHDPGSERTTMKSYDTNTNTMKNIADLQMTHLTKDDPGMGIIRDAKPGEQLILFGHDYEPPRSELHELYAQDSFSGKTSAMTLMGMADIASTTTTGKHLKPSINLSTHSRALVDKLYKSGAISKEDMPRRLRPNGIDFNIAKRGLRAYDEEKLDVNDKYQDLTSRVPHARARIRQALGNTSKNKSKNEQLQLEGFE
jgi:hypothetical protein